MAFTQTRLFGPVAAVTTATDSSAGRYLVPTGKTAIVKQILFCNTSGTEYSVRAGIGTTSTAANRFISDVWVKGSETFVFNCNIVMTAGEKLFITASDTSVTVMVNGILE